MCIVLVFPYCSQSSYLARCLFISIECIWLVYTADCSSHSCYEYNIAKNAASKYIQ